jgi:hypothetical protein
MRFAFANAGGEEISRPALPGLITIMYSRDILALNR